MLPRERKEIERSAPCADEWYVHRVNARVALPKLQYRRRALRVLALRVLWVGLDRFRSGWVIEPSHPADVIFLEVFQDLCRPPLFALLVFRLLDLPLLLFRLGFRPPVGLSGFPGDHDTVFFPGLGPVVPVLVLVLVFFPAPDPVIVFFLVSLLNNVS